MALYLLSHPVGRLRDCMLAPRCSEMADVAWDAAASDTRAGVSVLSERSRGCLLHCRLLGPATASWFNVYRFN